MKLSQLQAAQPSMVQNLLHLFHTASPSARYAGSVWYRDARRIVHDWAETYDYTPDTVAAVIAALSPQMDWNRNLIVADDILAGRAPSVGGALFANVRKAISLRDGDQTAPLAQRMVRTFPYGPKVYSFAANLAGDNAAVTVDTHAVQAAFNDVRLDVRLNWEHYRIVAVAYALAAQRVNVLAATFQAIIWHVWKEKNPPASKRLARREF